MKEFLPNAILGAQLCLTAKDDFPRERLPLRESGSENENKIEQETLTPHEPSVSVGLRFIGRIRNDLLNSFREKESEKKVVLTHGFVVYPRDLLNEADDAITKDYRGKKGAVAVIPAETVFAVTERYTYCTVRLSNIESRDYSREFIARRYLTCTDENGVDYTVYGEQYVGSVSPLAVRALSDENVDPATKKLIRRLVFRLS